MTALGGGGDNRPPYPLCVLPPWPHEGGAGARWRRPRRRGGGRSAGGGGLGGQCAIGGAGGGAPAAGTPPLPPPDNGDGGDAAGDWRAFFLATRFSRCLRRGRGYFAIDARREVGLRGAAVRLARALGRFMTVARVAVQEEGHAAAALRVARSLLLVAVLKVARAVGQRRRGIHADSLVGAAWAVVAAAAARRRRRGGRGGRREGWRRRRLRLSWRWGCDRRGGGGDQPHRRLRPARCVAFFLIYPLARVDANRRRGAVAPSRGGGGRRDVPATGLSTRDAGSGV